MHELAGDETARGIYRSENFRFSVAAPRFALDPSEVYLVYPPKGQIGDFANSLAHVVFTRRTLPWERSMTAGSRAPSDRRPWMALLVLSAADFPGGEFPPTRTLTVRELMHPPENAVGPRLELAAYEAENDLDRPRLPPLADLSDRRSCATRFSLSRPCPRGQYRP